MKHLKALAVTLLFGCALVAAPAAVWAEGIDVTPLSWDFGEVEVGAAQTHVFTITSTDTTPLTVYVVLLTPDMIHVCQPSPSVPPVDEVPCDFEITSAPPWPAIVPGGTSVAVEVAYTPSDVGLDEVLLYIVSDDSSGQGELMLPLTGSGVSAAEDPAELMAALLDFFDDSVAAGTLWGVGPGRSAEHRLRAYRTMLVIASILIDKEADRLACFALRVVREKADGAPWPPDFVDGPAREELVMRIEGVREALDCHACAGP
jgi:hypothetical protein